MSKIRYFKLNQDDIMEIVSEHIAARCQKRCFQTQSLLLGEPGKDLRMLIAVGKNNDHLDFDTFYELDKTMPFNGDHRANTGLSDEDMILAIDRMLRHKKY